MRTPKSALVACILGLGFGSASAGRSQVWEVDNRRLESPTWHIEPNFGYAAVAADFDGDGDDDLAVSAPNAEDWLNGFDNVGMVQVYWSAPDRSFVHAHQAFGTVNNGFFATVLAAGDFDGDGRPELAIGWPVGEVGDEYGAGKVRIEGYSAEEGWQFITFLDQDTPGVPGVSEEQDRLGCALAVGDFNHDDYDDLATGVCWEDWSGDDDGAVNVFYGGENGLTGLGSQLFGAGQDGVLGIPGDDDEFGHALAAGDFDDDGFADLAIGAPFRAVAGFEIAGQVHVLYGSASGLSAAGDQLFEEDDFGGAFAISDAFGLALAAGNFDRPPTLACALNPIDACADDLAIGVPGEDVLVTGGTQAENAGKIIVAYGARFGGISMVSPQAFTQNELAGIAQEDDLLGAELVAGDLDDGGAFGPRRAADLFAGVPGEDLDGDSNRGALHLLFGGDSRLGSFPDQLHYLRPGLLAAPGEEDDAFGRAAAIGDFDGDGMGDLAVGIPFRSAGGYPRVGLVQVLFGALFADGFESGGISRWSWSVP